MPDELTAALGDSLAVISGQLRLAFAATSPEQGFVALATLRHLARHGDTGVTDLARSDRVTPQAVSLRVSPLVAAGLVTRAPDTADARRTILRITPEGSRVLASARRHAVEALGEALEALDETHLSALATAVPALEALGARLTEHAKEGSR